MGYKLKQWVLSDSRTDEAWTERGKSRQSVEKRLGKQRYYITVEGTVKSLTKSRRAREKLEKRLERWKRLQLESLMARPRGNL